jgi:hypothetical protein
VTAAHCVLDYDGDVGPRTVVRGGLSYRAVAVLVDTRYHDHPTTQLDAAVLVMDQPLPGATAELGSVLPTQGTLTLAGYQPVDRDGTLLRGHGPHDLPLPQGATGTLVEIDSAPAGCDEPVSRLDTTPRRVTVHCGLIPGSSGGPLLGRRGDHLVLVGIISTVSSDLSANGVVPLASLHELLRHPDVYFHHLTNDNKNAAGDSVRSGVTRR